MVLAAGLGTRLRPITARIPKPLVQVLNAPNIVHTLLYLRQAGITDIILNTHYLAQVLEKTLGDGSQWGVKLTYSYEPALLGTGGGLKNVEWFFHGEPFVLCNCDFLTSAPLGPFLERHEERKALATMLLCDNASQKGRYAAVGVTAESHLCSLPSLRTQPPARTAIFTGIHILGETIFETLPLALCGINEVAYPKLMQKFPSLVYGDFFSRDQFWIDTGDPESVLSGSLYVLTALQNVQDDKLNQWFPALANYACLTPGYWSGPMSKLPQNFQAPVLQGNYVNVHESSVVGPHCVIGDHCTIGRHCQISQSLILPNTTVADGAVVRNQIIGNGLQMQATPYSIFE